MCHRPELQAVWTAALVGDEAELRRLVSEGASINAVGGRRRMSILAKASQQGYLGIVTYLLSMGADVDAQAEGQVGVLQCAITGKHESIALLLVDQGANVEHQDSKRCSVIQYAAALGLERLLAVLLKKGVTLNGRDRNGDTPLHLACFRNHLACVQLLVEAGADQTAVDNTGATPRSFAAERGHNEIVAYLDVMAKISASVTTLRAKCMALLGARAEVGVAELPAHLQDEVGRVRAAAQGGVAQGEAVQVDATD
eukprot:TRINITY_DN2539_c0_g1_i17.p1 TRINITY_DN2539_c0_g1~~TRINITY_DN2539_c0_g1_i17.p1  ORF type:complete len:255 (-),score=41.77 TRINITY_DN2539_c0_g1_i17:45-809(-)